MSFIPPPPVLSSELVYGRDFSTQAHVSDAQLAAISAETDQAAGDTWTHVKEVGSQVVREVDLADLLRDVSHDQTYQTPPPGWPALLKPTNPMMWETPSIVQEKYRTCQAMCFCGVFPELGRAWASVDNALFLWKYDASPDLVEYYGEEQAICTVGLVKPRPGVFLESTQYLLVLCTTVEIVLLGVGFRPGGVGLKLQQLQGYSLPSDNTLMLSVASTACGRIFLGGSDGNLYELTYHASAGWRQKRFQKTKLTGVLSDYIPPFLPQLLFGPPSPLVRLAVDDERHILYTLAENSSVQVFDLGADGKAPVKRVADISDVQEAVSRVPGSQRDKASLAIKYIAPVAVSESSRVHLVAVTADGSRLFFTTTEPATFGGPPASGRPSTLLAVPKGARSPPPQSGTIAIRPSGPMAARRSEGLKLVGAVYNSGTMLLSEAAGSDGRTTKLLAACRDLATSSAPPGLREFHKELDLFIPGETCALAAIPPRSVLGPEAAPRLTDDLHAEAFLGRPKFILVTTAGVWELERRRASDMLAAILEEKPRETLASFFDHYGKPEAAALCYILATAPTASIPQKVTEDARRTLDNPELVGVPNMPEMTAPPSGMNGSSMFDMGRAYTSPQPEWSAAHKGLCIYVSCLLRPVWDSMVVSPMKDANGGLMTCRLRKATMQAVTEKLTALDSFLRTFLSRRSGRDVSRSMLAQPMPGTARMELDGRSAGFYSDPVVKRQRIESAMAEEDRRTKAVKSLVSKSAQALRLLSLLSDNNIGRLALHLDEAGRRGLRSMTVGGMVCRPEDEELLRALISALVTEQLDSLRGDVQRLARQLGSECPSYFREEDRIYYAAIEKLRDAEKTAPGAQRDSMVKEAVAQLLGVPLSYNLERLTGQLAHLKNFEGIVDLALRTAAAQDPQNVAEVPARTAEAEAALQRRNSCYHHVLQVLKSLIDPAGSAAGRTASSLTAAERAPAKEAMLKKATKSSDLCFHAALYGALIEMGATDELLSETLNTPLLEQYLRRTALGPAGQLAPGAQAPALNAQQAQALQLLASFYINNRRFRDAAGVYRMLAERQSGDGQRVSLEERINQYRNAVLQAKSVGDASLVQSLEGSYRLATIQKQISDHLQERLDRASSDDERSRLEAALAGMQDSVRDMSTLFNDFAQEFEMWDVCLDLLHLSGVPDISYVRQYWDLLLKQASDQQADAGRDAQLAEACRRVQTLGARFYPNETSFPAAHVCLRLEQVSSGMWPEPSGSPPTNSDPALLPRTMMEACGDSVDAVMRVYDALLERRPGVVEPGAFSVTSTPARLKLFLLESLEQLCQMARNRLVDSAISGSRFGRMAPPLAPFSRSREAGLLAVACDRYALEARKLSSTRGEQLAQRFDVLRAELQPRR